MSLVLIRGCLFFVCVDLIKAFASQKNLAHALVELDPHYRPKQIDPIYKLLANLNNLSSIFLKAAKTFEEWDKEGSKKEG